MRRAALQISLPHPHQTARVIQKTTFCLLFNIQPVEEFLKSLKACIQCWVILVGVNKRQCLALAFAFFQKIHYLFFFSYNTEIGTPFVSWGRGLALLNSAAAFMQTCTMCIYGVALKLVCHLSMRRQVSLNKYKSRQSIHKNILSQRFF